MSKPASIPWSTRNKSESAKRWKPIPPPSPSASIILVSPTNTILLLHRVQTSSSFPSAHVFPGGNLEPSDGEIASSPTDPNRHQDSIAYRTGAIRELFEESGVLLARESSGSSSPLLNLPASTRLHGRKAIHSHQTTIREWLAEQSKTAVLDTDSLIPFTRWITPTNVPKRFTTQMYIYFLPTTSNDSQVATSDEIETMAPEWRPAHEWVSLAKSGKIILFPPQFLLLSLISDFLDSPSNNNNNSSNTEPSTDLASQRKPLIDFITKDSTPPWTHKIISPTALSFTRKDGRTVLGLDKPGPELKGVPGVKGDDSRVVLVRFSKEGPREVEVRWKDEVMKELREEEQVEAGKSEGGAGSKL